MEAAVTFGEAVVRHSVISFEEAFPVLVRDAYRVAHRLLGDRAEAEDIAQEACARAYSRWSSVRDHAEPWCVRVASNLAMDRLRSRTRTLRRDSELANAGTVGAVFAGSSADRVDLVKALTSLPRRQREVVVLRYLGDLSEAQTAEALGCSVGTVKTHASRGLARLREVVPR
jgi:RNA polymerase sigma-70 factor (sigma-E family)